MSRTLIAAIALILFVSCNEQQEPIPQEDSIYGSWQLVAEGINATFLEDESFETSVSNGYQVTFHTSGEFIAECSNKIGLFNRGSAGGPCYGVSSKLAVGTFSLTQNLNDQVIETTQIKERVDGQNVTISSSYSYRFEGQYLFIQNHSFDNGSFDKFVRIEPQSYED